MCSGPSSPQPRPAFWEDGSHLNRLLGSQVFSWETAAVAKLSILTKCHHVDPALVNPVIDALVEADRMLASTAIDDAVAARGAAWLTCLAQKSLSLADSYARGQARVGHRRLPLGLEGGGRRPLGRRSRLPPPAYQQRSHHQSQDAPGPYHREHFSWIACRA